MATARHQPAEPPASEAEPALTSAPPPPSPAPPASSGAPPVAGPPRIDRGQPAQPARVTPEDVRRIASTYSNRQPQTMWRQLRAVREELARGVPRELAS